ncbi:MAG: carbohydrate ABC transporter substrate-binding protein, partial [Lachnospiraceae bacterium]|nr:carbohydrate ABC transporter substrate-binding protein [Lachnospiraceae bacterium]
MKAKKLTALALASVMALSLAGCGNGNSGSNTASNNTTSDSSASSSSSSSSSNSASSDGSTSTTEEKLVIWTLADDLKQFAERYTEQTGVDCEITVIAPADYSTKLTSALGAKSSEVDIIVGEPQMLGNFFEAGFF